MKNLISYIIIVIIIIIIIIIIIKHYWYNQYSHYTANRRFLNSLFTVSILFCFVFHLAMCWST